MWRLRNPTISSKELEETKNTINVDQSKVKDLRTQEVNDVILVLRTLGMGVGMGAKVPRSEGHRICSEN